METLRAAATTDAESIWRWNNHPTTRAQSFSQDNIPWDSHVGWYAEKLASARCRIWLLEIAGVPIALARYDRDGGGAELSYVVAPDQRGKGYGRRVLDLSLPLAVTELAVPEIRATCFASNTASARCLLSAGFQCILEEIQQGVPSLIYVWRGPTQS